MRKVGYCIVGAGFISPYHSQGVISDPDAELIGFVDTNLKAAKEKQKLFGAKKSSDNLDEFLSDPEVTACIICVPPYLNREVVVKCAQAGKHILCEKPLATSLQDCDVMISACQKSGVILATGHCQLFYLPNVKAKELLNKGAIGELTFLRTTLATRTGRGPHLGWRGRPDQVGGGILSDPGIHRLYIMRYFFGNPISVRAIMDRKINPTAPGEDFVLSIFEFENNKTATVEICGGTSVWDVRTEVYGQAGIMIINGGDAFTNGPGLSSRLLEIYRPGEQISIPILGVGAHGKESFVEQIKDFTQCIMKKRVPVATGEDGKTILRLAKAVYESAHKGGTVVQLT